MRLFYKDYVLEFDVNELDQVLAKLNKPEVTVKPVAPAAQISTSPVSPSTNDRNRRDQNQELLKQIKLRDNYQCVKCRSKNKIHVHHIFSYSNYPHLRNEPSNLAVLCRTCHNRLHAAYGNTCDLSIFETFLHKDYAYKKELLLKLSND